MGGDLAVGQALRRQRQDHLIDAGQTTLTLLHNLRLERSLAVPQHVDLDRPMSVTTVLERFPFLEMPPFLPAGSCHSEPR